MTTFEQKRINQRKPKSTKYNQILPSKIIIKNDPNTARKKIKLLIKLLFFVVEIRLEIISSRLDELSENKQEMQAKITELSNKMDTLIAHLIKKTDVSSVGHSSRSGGGDDVREKRKIEVIEIKEPAIPLSTASVEYHNYEAQQKVLYSTTPLIYKILVPESKKSWDVRFSSYNPTYYTSPQVLNSDIADSDILSMWVKFM